MPCLANPPGVEIEPEEGAVAVGGVAEEEEGAVMVVATEEMGVDRPVAPRVVL